MTDMMDYVFPQIQPNYPPAEILINNDIQVQTMQVILIKIV